MGPGGKGGGEGGLFGHGTLKSVLFRGSVDEMR